MKVISTPLIKITNPKMLFLMVVFIKSKLLISTLLIEANMEMVVILFMKLLNIEVIIVFFSNEKVIVLSNVIIS